MVSRHLIEEADLARALKDLRPLTATPEDAWLYRCQMSLVVSGNEKRGSADRVLHGFGGASELFDIYGFPQSGNEALTAGVIGLAMQTGFTSHTTK